MSDPWFKFYASDFLGGVAGLTPAERGIYVTLLAVIYDNGGPVERRDQRLARVCGCTKAGFNKALAVLIEEGKILEVDGALTNGRAENELKVRANRSQNATDAAHARWSKEPEKIQTNQEPGDATAMQGQCERNAMPETRYQKPELEEDTVVSPPALAPEPSHANELSEACAEYNAAAERQGWPRMQKLTPQRRKALNARLRDAGGIEGWRIALEKAEASDFICSRGDRGWAGFGFDALTTASKFTKLMEGNYDNRDAQQHTGGAPSSQRQREDAATREYIRRVGNGDLDFGPDPSDPFAGR